MQSCACVELKRGRGNGTCKGPEVGKTLEHLQYVKKAPAAGIVELQVPLRLDTVPGTLAELSGG